MSALDILSKPISFRRPGAKAQTSAKADKSAASTPAVALGGVPRANLLPPSVIAAQRGRRAVRAMLGVVAASLVVVMLASAAAGWWALNRNDLLVAEQARTEQLLVEQTRYAEVSETLAGLAQRNGAVAFLGATDVLWADYLADVRETLPAGTLLIGATVEATTPLTSVTQDESALTRARAASIILTVSSPDLPAVQGLIDRLASLPGYTDAVLNSITLDPTGFYQASVSLGVDASVYSARFAPQEAAG